MESHQQKASQQGLYRPSYEHDACGIGAIASLKGVKSHQTLDDALSVLVNLEHRGGKGLERNTGDGAGVLFQIPHRFFRKEAQKEGQLLPDAGDYGVAMLFSPPQRRDRRDGRRGGPRGRGRGHPRVRGGLRRVRRAAHVLAPRAR